jgi:transposase
MLAVLHSSKPTCGGSGRPRGWKTIAVATVEGRASADVRFCGTIPNTPDAIRSLLRKLGKGGQRLHLAYEAGPLGYNLYRLSTGLGHRCDVVAPSLIPRKAGDKVKTDRRDAMMLAQLLRTGQLTEVWVPDEAHEAMRDLVRMRAQAMKDLRTTRQQLMSFLLRHSGTFGGPRGRRAPAFQRSWERGAA